MARTAPSPTPPDLESALRRLAPHDHLCLIYEDPEQQFQAIAPAIRFGLERGEKCIYVADEYDVETVRRELEARGVAAQPAIESGQLLIVTKAESYLRRESFDPDEMFRFLEREVQNALASGYKALRVAGEMTWALGDVPGADRLIEYEARLNYFFPKHPCLAICQYNRRRFPARIIRDVILTHPMVIYDGQVYGNVHYVPPDRFLSDGRYESEVDHLLDILAREREAVRLITEAKDVVDVFGRVSSEAFFELDVPSMRIHYSDSWFRMLGYENDELPQHYDTWTVLLHPDEKQEVQERVWEWIGEGQSFATEFRLRAADDSYRWFLVRGRCLSHQPDGAPERYVGAYTDISERKRIEARCAQRDMTLEAMPCEMLCIGADERVVLANERFAQAVGLSAEDMNNQTLDALSRALGQETALADVVRTAMREGSWQGLVTRQSPDGRRHTLECRAAQRPTPHEGVPCVVVTFCKPLS